jgi:hypothetical protein
VRKVMFAAALLFVAVASARTRDAYVMSVGGEPTIAYFSNGPSSPQLRTMQARYGHDFFWVRRDGREFVIHDAAFLAQAQALFAPMRALNPEVRAVAREEAALDREEDRLEDSEDDSQAVRDRLREIHARQREVEARERELDRRQEEMERVAEAKLWQMVDEAVRSGLAK